jgi:hypothetical protein
MTTDHKYTAHNSTEHRAQGRAEAGSTTQLSARRTLFDCCFFWLPALRAARCALREGPL